MRVPWTLLRQITLELWRYVLLITVVVVLVMAFGATTQHYAKGQLSAVDTLKFMLLASVPMLAYAIPFAGALAATLTYHRMAQDRELMAAQAGGMSLWAMLAPTLTAGLLLTATLVVLTEQVIPRFLQRMGEVASGQAAGLITRAIDRGEAIQIEGYLLYADRVISPPVTSPSVQAHLVLLGAHLIKIDEQGEIASWGAAATADLWIYKPKELTADELALPARQRGRSERVSEVIYRVRDAVGDGGRMSGVRMEEYSSTWTMPSGTGDHPKYLTWSEMRRVAQDPDPMGPIDAARRDLAYHLALRFVIGHIVDQLRTGRSVRLKGPDGSELVLRAGGILWNDEQKTWELKPPRNQPITIERFRPVADGTREYDRFELGSGTIDTALTGDPMNRGLELTLHGKAVRAALAERPASDAFVGGVREQASFGPLLVEDDPVSRMLAMGSTELLAAVDAHQRRWGGEDPFLRAPLRDLQGRIDKLRKQILSKQHERMAMSLTGILLAIAGAVAALRLQEAPPLAAYLGSFLPALLLVVLITTGQQMVDDYGRVGVPLLWAGPLAMAVAAALVARRFGLR